MNGVAENMTTLANLTIGVIQVISKIFEKLFKKRDH